MTRKSHLHSEILRRVKLRHSPSCSPSCSPSWAKKSVGSGSKPEDQQLFMPPVLN